MTITLNTHIQTQIHTQRLIKIAIDSVDVAVVTRAARTIVWKWKLDTVDWLEFDHRWHHCCCCCCSSCRLVVARPSPHWPSNRQSALEWTHIIETLLAIWFDFCFVLVFVAVFLLGIFFFNRTKDVFNISEKPLHRNKKGVGERKQTEQKKKRDKKKEKKKKKNFGVQTSENCGHTFTWFGHLRRSNGERIASVKDAESNCLALFLAAVITVAVWN